MIPKTVLEIENLSKTFSDKGENWHFHILTPTCKLNEKDEYALILENTTEEDVYVCYSSKPYMDIGKKLVQLLHGRDVIQENDVDLKEPSSQISKLLKRAEDLNKKEIFWHHHMLFPHCIFNKNKGKWNIIFEDTEYDVIIESVSDDEPKDDLKHIEEKFYNQGNQ
jgi:hypothetical protein